MKTHQKSIGITQEWLTPPEILSALGEFDLDPCASEYRPWPTAKIHYTESDMGLMKIWFGRVWCNPPFHRYQRYKWMEKMAEHNNGIMLIPAACETDAFYKYVWGKSSGILFLKGRPYFHYVHGGKAKSNSGCTICLIAYGDDNLQSLIDSKLGTVVKEIEYNEL